METCANISVGKRNENVLGWDQLGTGVMWLKLRNCPSFTLQFLPSLSKKTFSNRILHLTNKMAVTQFPRFVLPFDWIISECDGGRSGGICRNGLREDKVHFYWSRSPFFLYFSLFSPDSRRSEKKDTFSFSFFFSLNCHESTVRFI